MKTHIAGTASNHIYRLKRPSLPLLCQRKQREIKTATCTLHVFRICEPTKSETFTSEIPITITVYKSILKRILVKASGTDNENTSWLL